jgi:ActR/RegA family two-component response regulator/curved DNA-binding protein CbpA
MRLHQSHVLIVDDDATYGKALSEALTRAGLKTTLCNSSAQALIASQRQEFQCMIVDCMLPKMNGVDLVQEIGKLTLNKYNVFMISGIFKDRGFIKETVEKTGALNFFIKPLDLKEVVAAVQSSIPDEGDANDESPLLSIYSEAKMTDEELTDLIERQSAMASFHLPMIYRRLQQSSLNGELTLISSQGETFALDLHEGRVFNVRTPDKDSYFGGLAVGFGFVTPEQVLEGLQNPARKLLGQKLIESLSLSPHAIHVIMEEQLALRLSQTLVNGVVSMRWVAKKFPTPDYAMNPFRLETLVDEWSTSKVSAQWIKSNLLLWGSRRLEGNYHQTITDATTLDDLLARPTLAESSDLPYLYRQLMNGQAFIGGPGEDTRNFAFLEHRLERLLHDYKTQNHFQILGVSEKAQGSEIKKAFHDLKVFFDPAKLPPDSPPTVILKCTKVFQQIEQAFKILSDDVERGRYLVGLQSKRGQEILENEPIYRAAILELQGGQAAQAAKKLQTLIDKKLDFKDLRSYRIWAGINVDRTYADLTLDMIPPEERHSAAYMMAKGVYYKSRGQFHRALESFRSAHVLDPRLSIAKSELEQLAAELERKGAQKTLIRDVATVMENFFGRKRGA